MIINYISCSKSNFDISEVVALLRCANKDRSLLTPNQLRVDGDTTKLLGWKDKPCQPCGDSIQWRCSAFQKIQSSCHTSKQNKSSAKSFEWLPVRTYSKSPFSSLNAIQHPLSKPFLTGSKSAVKIPCYFGISICQSSGFTPMTT